jgi:hypothetical protein
LTQCTSFVSHRGWALNDVVAEGLDAREVLDAAPVGVEERLIDHEVVRVAVDEHDRLLERDRLVSQQRERMSWKPSGLPSVSTSVAGSRFGAPW